MCIKVDAGNAKHNRYRYLVTAEAAETLSYSNPEGVFHLSDGVWMVFCKRLPAFLCPAPNRIFPLDYFPLIGKRQFSPC
jgi:hypothetical protein